MLWVLYAFATSGQGQTTQSAVTLWQFGAHRLLGGQTTLPLQPLGTADNGLATTYLYQVQNLITIVTTDTRGIDVDVPTMTATPRTIAISASGWFEIFGTSAAVSCGYADATFGQCQDLNSFTTTLANSGAPTPVVIPISRILNEISASKSVPTSSSATSLSSNTPQPSQTNDPVQSATTPPIGAIVGGVLGALVVVIGALITLWRCRRRRLRRISDEAPRAYTGPTDSSVPSRIPTSELVRTLDRQMQNGGVGWNGTAPSSVFHRDGRDGIEAGGTSRE
ncbi:hypothetical protein MSAN_01221000 [Mycena sanguinolenta]|uniref:Mid2 domain-containing protein n=1 Tax=Mycena sanguinolenta TaxID=230812 RepID=A0A8H6YD04_9AGAR|nr:hypothetical protein MSAN_01221000 [Mycena sanguinolenta]